MLLEDVRGVFVLFEEVNLLERSCGRPRCKKSGTEKISAVVLEEPCLGERVDLKDMTCPVVMDSGLGCDSFRVVMSLTADHVSKSFVGPPSSRTQIFD